MNSEVADLLSLFVNNIHFDSHNINSKVNRSPAAREIVWRGSQSAVEGTKMIAELVDHLTRYNLSG